MVCRNPLRLDDFVGPAAAIAEMRGLVKVLKGEDESGSRRVLVTGPPGCGKNSMVMAAANDAGVECVWRTMSADTLPVEILQVFREARAKTGTVLLVIDYSCPGLLTTEMLVQESSSVRNSNLVVVLIGDSLERMGTPLGQVFTHVPVGDLDEGELLELLARVAA